MASLIAEVNTNNADGRMFHVSREMLLGTHGD